MFWNRDLTRYCHSSRARVRTAAAVNTALIDLYWSIGEHISRKVAQDGWGQGTVTALAEYIRGRLPNSRGFSAQNLWRMRQFFETYCDHTKLSPPVRELPWTHNLLILTGSKRAEEREFYLRIAVQERWSKRQLERQLSSALFERVALSPVKLAPPVREIHPDAASVFKDTYLVEFLDLPRTHSEADLHDALVKHLKDFLIELGRDFCFVASHFPIQVGGTDFEIDLLFFHRGLNCLVDIELKIDRFRPEHLGKLEGQPYNYLLTQFFATRERRPGEPLNPILALSPALHPGQLFIVIFVLLLF